MRKYSILFSLCLFAGVVHAQHNTETVNRKVLMKIKAEGFERSKVMETLFQLTDVNGPRLTGSTGLMRAEKWARQQLADWGLKNAQLEPWGSFGKGWENQKCYVAMTQPYYQPLIAVPKAWTPGTNGPISSQVVLVKASSLKDLDVYAGKLSGKIVVIAPATTDIKMNFKPDAKRYTAEELSQMEIDPHIEDEPENSYARNREVYRAQAAMRIKIDSFLLSQKVAAVIGASRGGSMGTIFTSNGASYNWDAPQVLPALEMATEDINRLTRLLEKEIAVSLDVDIKNTFLTADSTAYNVIAEIPGTDKELAAEVVMLGAHIDSWHASTGATDNATGVAVMMEAVRIIKALKLQPRRTIRIALWSGEEQGLHGSRNYVKNHFGDVKTMKLKPEHSRISAYYNLDNGAGKIRGIYLQGNDAARPLFETWLAPFKDLGANTVTIRNTGSTDHVAFDAIGIPGFQFIQDQLEYFTRTHHTNMDSYDRVNKNDMMQASVIVASLVYSTAMSSEPIPRKSLPEVKK